MHPLRSAGALAVAVVSAFWPGTALAHDEGAIRDAVNKGVDFLKQFRVGTYWPHHFCGEHDVGQTALCALALVEAGTPRTDGAVLNAANFVRKSLILLDKSHCDNTYSLCLAVMLLDRVFDDAEIGPLIQKLTVRIAAGQNQANGGWSYNCPALNENQHKQWLKFLEDNQDKPLADGVPKSPEQGGVVDHSNTQFAILALWIGRRHNVPVNYSLFLAERRFRKMQRPSGGWEYCGGAAPGETPSMTCAGLLALSLGYSASKETGVTIVRSARRPDAGGGGDLGVAPREGGGNIPPRGDLDSDPQVLKAQKFLINAMRQQTQAPIPRFYYYVWSLERVCVIYGWEKMAGFDWYDWGSRLLLSKQKEDGRWYEDFHTGAAAETAFAILFLVKANLADDARRLIVRSENPNKVAKQPPERQPRGPGSGRASSAKPPQAPPDAPGAADAAPPPQPVADADVPEANRLRDIVVNGAGPRQLEALKRLRETPGKAYTLALAEAVTKIGGAWRNQVRDALAERLTRQTPNSLQFYLRSDDKELKMAAAWAAALRSCSEVIPDIIPLLGDTDETVSAKAQEALKILSGGEDFGKAAEKWKSWWDKHGKAPAEKKKED